MPQTPKLNKFGQFVEGIFPHEVDYLQSVARFEDTDNIDILNEVEEVINGRSPTNDWNQQIDKRKYSRLMQWMQHRLQRIDVDHDYAWLLRMEEKVMTDSINPREEKEIIKKLKGYEYPEYNFMRLYQLAQHFSSFLMIRMRNDYQEVVQHFLEERKLDYLRCRDTYQQLNDATNAIVSQYKGARTNTRHWESWLTSVFQNTQLDGLNRYSAIVRLTFLYYNYKDYTTLNKLYEELDVCFSGGLFYSRRILVNYYSNRVLMHAQFNEWEKAEHYAFLSIKFKGADYIHYLNNLSAILLRSGKSKTALKIMQGAFGELKNTTSSHNRVGFVAFYTRALNLTNQSGEALRYATNFLEANKEDVLQNRWHLFFSTLMQSMLYEGKYDLVTSLVKKYKLLDKDKIYESRPNYMPTFKWYVRLAHYKQKHATIHELLAEIMEDIGTYTENKHRKHIIKDLYNDMRKVAPELPLSLDAAIAYHHKQMSSR